LGSVWEAWRGKLAAAPLPIDGGNVHRGNSAITIEVQTNNAKVQQLASDKGLKVAQNVAAGVAGLVIPVLWFGMDFQGTADAEIQALQARQQYLSALAEQRPRQRQGIIVRGSLQPTSATKSARNGHAECVA
jgi:hypothetical protein